MSKKSNAGFSNIGFILAAIGSAVGLGNLWYFPTALIQYGGIAFLIPYLVALIVLGLPFFVLESILGNKWRRSPVVTFRSYWKTAGPFFGCLQAFGQVIIGSFYVWVIAWVLLMFFSAFSGNFGSSFAHFDEEILGTVPISSATKVESSNMSEWGTSIWSLILVIGILLFCFFIINLGIKRGIEMANRIMIPVLFLLLMGFVVYAFTIDGFERGVEAIFKPNLKKLANFKAWRSGFSKALFSLSLVVAVIMIFSAYAPKDRDNTTQAFIVISGDTLVAILGGFIIAATIGGMMKSGLTIGGEHFQMGTVIETTVNQKKVVAAGNFQIGGEITGWNAIAIFKDGQVVPEYQNISGSTLIFKVFPVFFSGIGKTANWKPLGNILGIFFFLSALFAGLSSLIAQVETGTAVLQENTKLSRIISSVVVVLIQFFFGIFFLWNANHNALDGITGDFLVGWLLLILAFQQALMFVTNKSGVYELVAFNNQHSKIKWNRKFFYGLLVLALFSISFIIIADLISTIKTGGESFTKFSSFQWIVLSFCFFVPMIAWVIVILYGSKIHNYFARKNKIIEK